MLPVPPILLVTDRNQAKDGLASAVAGALRGGVRWVSVREKDLPEGEQVAILTALRPLAHAFDARLTLHGSAALAETAGADGVHLSAGGDVAEARGRLGHRALVGQSVHTLGEVRGADPDLADYLIAGPAFETASKPGYGPALDTQGLKALGRVSRVPLLAIGGVTVQTLPACKAAEVAGVAVMGSIMRAADPEAEMRSVLQAWER